MPRPHLNGIELADLGTRLIVLAGLVVIGDLSQHYRLGAGVEQRENRRQRILIYVGHSNGESGLHGFPQSWIDLRSPRQEYAPLSQPVKAWTLRIDAAQDEKVIKSIFNAV